MVVRKTRMCQLPADVAAGKRRARHEVNEPTHENDSSLKGLTAAWLIPRQLPADVPAGKRRARHEVNEPTHENDSSLEGLTATWLIPR
jgi:hypothetical protein